ncbi:hypothetical protein D3C85_1447340 [compost metagenome]
MGQQELQRQLRPTADPHLRGPPWQGLALQSCEQTTATEGPVADHRHTALATQRQDAFLDTAIVQGIVDLQKIQRFGLEQRFHFVVSRRRVMGDADIANAPLFLPLAQCR